MDMENAPRAAAPPPAGRLALPEELFEDQRGDRFLFFDPQGFVWFHTDQLGKEALTALADEGTTAAAAERLAAQIGAPRPLAVSFVADFARRLLDLGFLHHGTYRRARWSDGLLPHPFALHLHLTMRCNLSCAYCYHQAHRRRLAEELPPALHRLIALVDEMAELGFRDLHLTGGECLLHPHTLDVARHARRRGLVVDLATNGTLIDEETAALIAESVDRVSLSLDSPHAAENDAMRGPGSHRKAVAAFHLLRQAGVARIGLNAVVTPANKDSVEDLLTWAWDDLRANDVTLAPSVLAVEGAGDDSRLGGEEIAAVLAARRRFEQERRTPPERIAPGELRRTHSGAADVRVSVDSNGDLYPCHTLLRPELRCGNVFESGLRRVLDTSDTLRRVKHLTVDRLQTCRGCAMRYLCAGGDRMEAYSRHGRLNAHHTDLCAPLFRRAVDELWGAVCVPE
jgi:radical SAM protein with 4Fe4S-binding SPASM domain